MGRRGVMAACLLVLCTATPKAQQPAKDGEMQKIVDAYTQAWAKGDAKAIAALHATDAIRASPDGRLIVGRAAIEQDYVAGFSGPLKGTTLVITSGSESMISPNTRVGSGTWEITGGTPTPGMATKGSYINTVVRQGGRWLIVSSAAIGAQPGS